MPRHQALEEETSPSSFSSHSDPATYPYPSLIYLCIELRALGMLGKSSIPSSRYLFSPRDFFTRDMSGSDPPQYSVSDGRSCGGHCALFCGHLYPELQRSLTEEEERLSVSACLHRHPQGPVRGVPRGGGLLS